MICTKKHNGVYMQNIDDTHPKMDTELVKAARRAYRRMWYKTHKEQARMYQNRWFIRKARELGLINDDGEIK